MTQETPIYSINHYLPGNQNITWNKQPNIRNKGTWENHLKSISSYCKSQATMYDNTNHRGGTIVKKPNNCNSWDCPECRKKKASVLKSRITEGTVKQSWRLLTLTFDPKTITLQECLNTCSHSWDVFQKKLKRAFPDIAWIKVLEFQANGYPHYHIIVNKFISKSFLSWAWMSVGGGAILKIQKVKTKHISNYVSNYLSNKNKKHHERDYQFFYYALRRFAFSRNFHLRPWERTTVIFTRGIDFDCINDLWDNAIKLVYRSGVFYAVNKQNQIKYINLQSNSIKLREC